VIILGIDPGLAATGYGVINKQNNEINTHAWGVVKTKAESRPEKRLKKIYESILKIIEKHEPETGACEDLFFSKNKKTAKKVFQARGATLAAFGAKGIPVKSYKPQSIKKALTGYGRADKKQMQEMTKVTLGLKEIPEPDHAADALACALCHARVST
jgi:crossover junction endodeoxyribonuclease RuvC